MEHRNSQRGYRRGAMASGGRVGRKEQWWIGWGVASSIFFNLFEHRQHQIFKQLAAFGEPHRIHHLKTTSLLRLASSIVQVHSNRLTSSNISTNSTSYLLSLMPRLKLSQQIEARHRSSTTSLQVLCYFRRPAITIIIYQLAAFYALQTSIFSLHHGIFAPVKMA